MINQLLAMLRRPDNRTGLLMSVAGLVWFGRDFDWFGGDATRHLDALAGNLFVAMMAHLLVVFPDIAMWLPSRTTVVP